MIQKFSKSMFCVAAALLMFNTCTQDNGTSPYDCSKTKAVILLKSSNKSVISYVAIKDTIGDSIYYGFCSNLIMNIDSVEIRKVSASDNTGDIIFTFKNIQSLKNSDTIWNSLVLSDTGTITITGTAFLNCNKQLSATATVTIISRPTNDQPPKWQYDTVNEVFAVGQTLTLTLSNMCSDPNDYPITYSLVSGKPTGDTIKAGVYSFTPVASDTGISWPRIVAKNSAALTDTVTLHLTVTAVDRQAPYLKLFSPATDSTIVKTNTQTVKVICKDPSGVASVKCSMGTDTFSVSNTDSIYSATVTGLKSTGMNEILFIAIDSSVNANKDTLKVHIKYTPLLTDSVGPVITLVTPAKDSATTNSLSYAFKVMCKDPSGIASLKCSMGTDTFSVSNTDSIYSATVTGLKSTGMNEILFIAIDSSVTANRDTLKVHIKYTPLLTDSVGPVITLVTPAKDSASTNSSSYVFKVMCKDPSGVASLKCSMGTDTFSVSNTDSIYSATVSGLKSTGMNEILFIATDASVNANKDTLKVHIKYTPLVTDSVGPTITLVTPAKDSTSTNSSSYAVKLTCTDTSGVLSVNGVLGTTAFTGVRGTGNNWTITVNGLTANVFNTIIFTATDSSLRANKTMDTLYIKYDPTMLDSIAPTIVQKSGPASGSFISDPLVTIVDTIYDPSGVDSVYWKLNNGSVKLLTKANGKYSLTDSVKREKLDTIVVIAIDSSTRRNRDTQIVILNYIIAPKITTQPVSKAVCSGSQAIFSVAATGTSPLSYQWRTGAASFTDITGATNPACTLSNVTSAQTILSCVVSNQSTASATSNLCTLTVNQPPTISNPLATSICFGNSGATMTVTASSGATLQWFKGSPVGTHTSLTNNSNYSGVDAATLTFNNGFSSMQDSFYCVATTSGCLSTSTTAYLTVNTTPTITEPTNQSTCPGVSVNLTVSASGGTNFQYQWFSGTSPNGIIISNATSSSFPTSTAGSYYCQVTNSSGCSANSGAASVTVNSPPTISAPYPSSQQECSGWDATFSVTATAGSTFQWYKLDGTNGLALTNGNIYSNVTSTVLHINCQPGVEGSYYCIATNNGCSKQSTNASLTLYPEITITTDLPSEQSWCIAGQLSLTAIAMGGSGTLTKKWGKDGVLLSASNGDYMEYGDGTFINGNIFTIGDHSISCEISDGTCSKKTTTMILHVVSCH